MSNEERLSDNKLIKIRRRPYKVSVQKQKDEEYLIAHFKKSDRVWWKICEWHGVIGLEEWRNDYVGG